MKIYKYIIIIFLLLRTVSLVHAADVLIDASKIRGNLDNVNIGQITPALINGTNITGSTIATDCVSNTEFSYSSGLTSPIQLQINLKAPVDSPHFTSNAIFDNEVTAKQFNSTATDNSHYINVSNSRAPSNPAVGDCYYDNTTLMWLCWTGSAWGTIASGTALTVDSPGKIAIDTSTDQFIYYGVAAQVLDPRQTASAVFKSPVSGDKAKWKRLYPMTVTSVSCLVDAPTSAVLDIQECNTSGTSCSTILTSPITCTTNSTGGSLADTAIAAGNYVFFSVGTVTGTVGYLYVTFNYKVTRE